MDLHVPPARVRHIWCGPYAVAATTGVAVEVIEEKINEQRLKAPTTPVRRSSVDELCHVLSELGYEGTITSGFRFKDRSSSGRSRPTLAAWLKGRRGDEMKTSYIVLVTGHFVAVRGRKIICSQTREARFIRNAPGRRKRVQYVIGVGSRPRQSCRA